VAFVFFFGANFWQLALKTIGNFLSLQCKCHKKNGFLKLKKKLVEKPQNFSNHKTGAKIKREKKKLFLSHNFLLCCGVLY
jgi:hypothetical protein